MPKRVNDLSLAERPLSGTLWRPDSPEEVAALENARARTWCALRRMGGVSPAYWGLRITLVSGVSTCPTTDWGLRITVSAPAEPEARVTNTIPAASAPAVILTAFLSNGMETPLSVPISAIAEVWIRSHRRTVPVPPFVASSQVRLVVLGDGPAERDAVPCLVGMVSDFQPMSRPTRKHCPLQGTGATPRSHRQHTLTASRLPRECSSNVTLVHRGALEQTGPLPWFPPYPWRQQE